MQGMPEGVCVIAAASVRMDTSTVGHLISHMAASPAVCASSSAINAHYLCKRALRASICGVSDAVRTYWLATGHQNVASTDPL